uniref:Ig-like domain-containing protein n=1 Tax=Dicentrarchus labrax TaxID=13489 RepID=A0A8C4H1N1_DICLA
MSLLGLILIFVLHFEAGISGEPIYLYNRSGHDVILPCASASPSDTTCSNVTWIYSRDRSQSFIEVWEGKVEKSSARAARMSLDTSCSLVINNITAEDIGQYACRHGTSPNQSATVYLSVLTISPSPPDADPERDGEVTLVCSVSRHNGLDPCQLNSVRWVNETGTVLLDEGVGYKFLRQMSCVSVLKVKRQSGHNRTYTCQFVDENNVKIEADYTPVFIGGTGDDQPEKPHSDSTDWPLSPIMLALRITGLILMIVITVLVIRHRGEETQTIIW